MDGSQQPVLDPASGVSTPAPGSPEQEKRINDLMSLWQKTQSEKDKVAAAKEESDKELVRLQTLVARESTEKLTYKQQLDEISAKHDAVVKDLESKVQEAAESVKAKDLDVQKYAATAIRAEFLIKNPDLAAYAEILPQTNDLASLESTAKVIREANKSQNDAVRDHLMANGRSGGAPPRVAPTKRSPQEIQAYLNSAIGNPAEFEKRLAEVRGA